MIMNGRFFGKCILITTSLFLSGFGFNQNPSSVCESGLAAFTTETHPFLRSRCLECHGENGMGPGHSVENTRVAYQMAKEFINFQDIASSRMVTHVNSKHWLEYDPNAVGATGDEIMPRLQAWWDMGQRECPEESSIVTGVLPLPEDLPLAESGRFISLRWDLSVISSSWQGAFFELEIQRFTEGTNEARGSYRVRKPRLATPEKTVHLKGIRVLVNDQYDPLENTYTSIEKTVSASSFEESSQLWPFPVLSSQLMIVIEDEQVTDQVSIAFDILEVVNPRACQALDAFQSKVESTMVAKRCFNCHSGGPEGHPGVGNGRIRFPMTGTSFELCAKILERVDFGVPEMSPIIQYPMHSANGHPLIITNPQDTQPSWIEWIEAEKTTQ